MEVPNDFGTTTESQLRTRLAAAERERDEAQAMVKIYQGEREMCPHCRELRRLRARVAALEEGIRAVTQGYSRFCGSITYGPAINCYTFGDMMRNLAALIDPAESTTQAE